ncbi:hypothetical protein GK047_17565 [Paenibacillus sp. SYP-B3998]|uniref:Copper amine oxidase-like N-terminal domain-containing protein n=1 Tax=Paenibacillus sp. SYP-B3998 TaxID=2678564 RepID=A0A6G4A1W2_9BACL|nr:hypothetical protein [Paenibacillus sp. SYP-B3998]NEW07811.1 hypothetical protein [Paenibacillus sp. SYP-B3998]
MKKYIIGGLVGFVIATAAGAHAQEVNKLIDQVVQGVFPVTVAGNSLGDAIVVDNKTYLPVREFGEAAGYKVTFTDDRKVVLTKNTTPSGPKTSQQPTPTPAPTTQDKIDQYNVLIKNAKVNIAAFEDKIKNFPSPNNDDHRKTIDKLKADIVQYEKEIADLKNQK